MFAPAGVYRLEAKKCPVKHLTDINHRILNRFSTLSAVRDKTLSVSNHTDEPENGSKSIAKRKQTTNGVQ